MKDETLSFWHAVHAAAKSGKSVSDTESASLHRASSDVKVTFDTASSPSGVVTKEQLVASVKGDSQNWTVYPAKEARDKKNFEPLHGIMRRRAAAEEEEGEGDSRLWLAAAARAIRLWSSTCPRLETRSRRLLYLL